MNNDEILQYSSFGIGIFGIIIAFVQGFERRKLKQFMYSQAWHIFTIASLSYGSAQSELITYKEKITPEIFESLLNLSSTLKQLQDGRFKAG